MPTLPCSEKINAIKERTHIVLLPEMFSTGFSMKPEELAETMHGPTVEWMKRVSASRKVILAGSLMIEEEAIIITGSSGYCPTVNWVFMINDISLRMQMSTNIMLPRGKED